MSQTSFSKFRFERKYDVILALAVLHFFNTQEEVENYLKILQENTNSSGIHILSFPSNDEENRNNFTLLLNPENIKFLYTNPQWEIINGLTGYTYSKNPNNHKYIGINLLVARKKITNFIHNIWNFKYLY